MYTSIGEVGAPVEGARRLGLLLFESSFTAPHPAFVKSDLRKALTLFVELNHHLALSRV